jgi:hypothetical protein
VGRKKWGIGGSWTEEDEIMYRSKIASTAFIAFSREAEGCAILIAPQLQVNS